MSELEQKLSRRRILNGEKEGDAESTTTDDPNREEAGLEIIIPSSSLSIESHQATIKELPPSGEVTSNHVELLLTFIKSLDKSGSSAGEQEEVTLKEFEAAFRNHKSSGSRREKENAGRGLMKRLEHLLTGSKLSIEDWFRLSDNRGAGLKKNTSGGTGDGKLTQLELTNSIAKLCRNLNMPAWSKQDVVSLLRYMDPNADLVLSLPEVLVAFKRFHAPPEYLIMETISPVFSQLDAFMKQKKMRVRDLFRIIDTNNSNTISFSEMRNLITSSLIISDKPNKTSSISGPNGIIGDADISSASSTNGQSTVPISYTDNSTGEEGTANNIKLSDRNDNDNCNNSTTTTSIDYKSTSFGTINNDHAYGSSNSNDSTGTSDISSDRIENDGKYSSSSSSDTYNNSNNNNNKDMIIINDNNNNNNDKTISNDNSNNNNNNDDKIDSNDNSNNNNSDDNVSNNYINISKDDDIISNDNSNINNDDKSNIGMDVVIDDGEHNSSSSSSSSSFPHLEGHDPTSSQELNQHEPLERGTSRAPRRATLTVSQADNIAGASAVIERHLALNQDSALDEGTTNNNDNINDNNSLINDNISSGSHGNGLANSSNITVNAMDLLVIRNVLDFDKGVVGSLVDASMKASTLSVVMCMKYHLSRRLNQAFNRWRRNIFIALGPFHSNSINNTYCNHNMNPGMSLNHTLNHNINPSLISTASGNNNNNNYNDNDNDNSNSNFKPGNNFYNYNKSSIVGGSLGGNTGNSEFVHIPKSHPSHINTTHLNNNSTPHTGELGQYQYDKNGFMVRISKSNNSSNNNHNNFNSGGDSSRINNGNRDGGSVVSDDKKRLYEIRGDPFRSTNTARPHNNSSRSPGRGDNDSVTARDPVTTTSSQDELLSKTQIELFVKYVKSCCNDMTTKEITLPEFEASFRRHMHASLSKERENAGRVLMERLEYLLTGNKLSIVDWFRLSDNRGAGLKKNTSGGTGDGKLTQLELTDSISMLCRNLNMPAWSKQDVVSLLRFMDPNADSDLSFDEALAAFKRYHAPPEYLQVLKACTPIIAKLEAFMKRRHMRVKDLFMSIDTDSSDTISFDELSLALLNMIGSKSRISSSIIKSSLAHPLSSQSRRPFSNSFSSIDSYSLNAVPSTNVCDDEGGLISSTLRFPSSSSSSNSSHTRYIPFPSGISDDIVPNDLSRCHNPNLNPNPNPSFSSSSSASISSRDKVVKGDFRIDAEPEAVAQGRLTKYFRRISLQYQFDHRRNALIAASTADYSSRSLRGDRSSRSTSNPGNVNDISISFGRSVSNPYSHDVVDPDRIVQRGSSLLGPENEQNGPSLASNDLHRMGDSVTMSGIDGEQDYLANKPISPWITSSTVGSVTPKPNLTVTSILPSSSHNSTNKSSSNSSSKTNDNNSELLSKTQIELFVKYVKSCCNDMTTKEITLPEFEASFRRHMHASLSKERENAGRVLMERLEYLLTGNKLSIVDWFRLSDNRGAGLKKNTSGGTGDGKLTQLELTDSISMLCRNLNMPAWSKQDVVSLLRYMDPNADSDLSFDEALAAFKRYHAPPEYLQVLKACTPIIAKLEAFMKRRHMRVKDLFMSIDTDSSDTISFDELFFALIKMVGPQSSLSNSYSESLMFTNIYGQEAGVAYGIVSDQGSSFMPLQNQNHGQSHGVNHGNFRRFLPRSSSVGAIQRSLSSRNRPSSSLFSSLIPLSAVVTDPSLPGHLAQTINGTSRILSRTPRKSPGKPITTTAGSRPTSAPPRMVRNHRQDFNRAKSGIQILALSNRLIGNIISRETAQTQHKQSSVLRRERYATSSANRGFLASTISISKKRITNAQYDHYYADRNVAQSNLFHADWPELQYDDYYNDIDNNDNYSNSSSNYSSSYQSSSRGSLHRQGPGLDQSTFQGHATPMMSSSNGSRPSTPISVASIATSRTFRTSRIARTKVASSSMSSYGMDRQMYSSRGSSYKQEREDTGRRYMERLEYLLTGNNLSIEDWFRLSDNRGAGLKKNTSGGTGDGKLTQLELTDSITALCRNLNMPAWSKQDVVSLLRYMDPNADSDLSFDEALAAFKRYHAPPEYLQAMQPLIPERPSRNGMTKAQWMLLYGDLEEPLRRGGFDLMLRR